MIFSFSRILSLFRRRAADEIEPLYGAMMAVALDPVLFRRFSVPDTFEGRFEAVTLTTCLILRRLKALPPPAADVAQDLVDRTFDGLESEMRAIGISDNGLPRRMKKFAQGFYGRLDAYTAALAPGAGAEALGQALGRNLLEGAEVSPELAAHVRTLATTFDALSLDDLVAGRLTTAAPTAET